MNTFQTLEDVLANRKTPLKVFFRDDDGGWADARLQKLAHAFIQQQLPLDVAVIPGALSAQSIELLTALLKADAEVAIHQHGYNHTNHQLSGRSCEFGTDRTREQQHLDISRGQQKLTDLFGAQIAPVFTPPWNRCTSDTAHALKSLGFRYLSRIIGSEPIDDAITELPVAVDWLKKRKGERLNTAELVQYISGLFSTENDTIGVMLHHEHMDKENRELFFQFIGTLRKSQRVSFHPMLNVSA